MSYIKCPNYIICENSLFIGSDDEEEYPEGNRDNKIDIFGSPIRDPLTNKFTLIKLEYEIPVCWECGSSYSDVENKHQNKYLSFTDSMECCICFKTTRGVSFPNCLHYTCIPCHKRCFFGPDPINLDFPYPADIKKLYLSDPNNSIWEKDHKIKEYKQKDNQLEIDRMIQWEREPNLRKCPLCRS